VGVINAIGRGRDLFTPGSAGLFCISSGKRRVMQLSHRISNVPGNCYNGTDVSLESPIGDISIIVKLMPQCFIHLFSADVIIIRQLHYNKYENPSVYKVVSIPGTLAV
jgi:hypothetical protein